MVAIFMSSFQNLSPLPTSLKVKPLFKRMTGLNFFVNTAKTKIKVNFSQVSTLSLRPFVNKCPGLKSFCKIGPRGWIHERSQVLDKTQLRYCSNLRFLS